MQVCVRITDPSTFIFWHLPDELFGLVYSNLDICTIVEHESLCRAWHNRLKSGPVSNAIWHQISSRLLVHQRLNPDIGVPTDWKTAFRSLIRFESSDWSCYTRGDIVHHDDNEMWNPTARTKLVYCQRYSQTQEPNTELHALRFGQHIVFSHLWTETEKCEISIVDVIAGKTWGPFRVHDLSISVIAALGSNFEECDFIPLVRSYVSEDYVLNQVGCFSIRVLTGTGDFQETVVPSHIINLMNLETIEAFAYNRILVSSAVEFQVWDLSLHGANVSKILTVEWERSDESQFALTKDYVIACCPSVSFQENVIMANVFSLHSGQLLNIIEMGRSTPFVTNDIIFMQNQRPIALMNGVSVGVTFDSEWVDPANLDVALDGSLIVMHEVSPAHSLFETTHVVDVYSGHLTSHKVGQYNNCPGALIIYRQSKFTRAQAKFLPYSSNLSATDVMSCPCLNLEKNSDEFNALKLKIMAAFFCLLLLACVLILPLNLYESQQNRFQSNLASLFSDSGCSSQRIIFKYD